MLPRNRRRFIRETGLGVAGLAAAPKLNAASSASATGHRELRVPGVHAYARQESVAAGEEIEFCVSADTTYEFSVVRLGHDPDSPAKDDVLHIFPSVAERVQSIHPGSYVHVDRHIEDKLAALSLEIWVRPWSLNELVGLITQEDKQAADGFALGVGKNGYVGFFVGDGHSPDEAVIHRTSEGLLQKNRWNHIVATWDGKTKFLWVDGKLAGQWFFGGYCRPGRHPLRIGAMGDEGRSLRFADADLAMPVIYSRALSGAEVMERFAQKGLLPPKDKDVLACWPLDEEKGDRVRDVSGNGRHGRIINHATWMIGGPGFDAQVDRFGDYDPRQDPQRGHGLRLASDDLYDCGWEVTHRYRVPHDAKSGVYVGRLRFQQADGEHLQHVTFIVRKPKNRKRAPILVLCATNTWRAYSGTPFGRTSAKLRQVFGTDGTQNSPGDPPAFNFYRNHAAGQGTYQQGLRMPWPVAGPYVLYGGPTNYSHLMRAERFAHIWLEQAGYEFDVISDLDLHRDPDQGRGYDVFLINGHSEYWSIPMYRGLERFLNRGGNAIVLSGNSLFWRVSFNDEGTILECRKVDAPGEQLPRERRGECWHSQDGLRGGLTNECGIPGWKLIGLTTLGWNNQGNPKNFGPYVAELTEHFLFTTPEPVGLKPGDKFGGAGKDDQTPLANGHEFDIRLSTLAALQEQPSPPGQSVPADPAGMVRLANGVIPWKEGGAAFDYWFNPIQPKTDQGGEMIYWERPEGGRVFNAGSIGSGWALGTDPKFQALLRNVLHHFGVRRPS
ncbi:MAG: N,N-dimethylformamidase beta subunit family domain-containing protein [Verrucomicrobiales bacterium]